MHFEVGEVLKEPYYYLPIAAQPERYSVGDEQLVLLPLYRDAFYGTHKADAKGLNRLEAYARMALHARRTWMEHTDAREHGVAVKFYIESEIVEWVRPVFEEGGVDMERDVLLFSDARPAVEWARISKNLAGVWDARLREYRWVIFADLDLFMPAGGISFFERLSGIEPLETGFMDTLRGTFAFMQEKRRMAEGYKEEYAWLVTCAKQTRQTVDRVRQHLEAAGFEWRHEPGSEVLIPCLCLIAYPARHCHRERAEWIEWVRTWLPRLGTGETCAAIWHKVFGYPFWSIGERLGLEMEDPWAASVGAEALLHGRPSGDAEAAVLLERIGYAAL